MIKVMKVLKPDFFLLVVVQVLASYFVLDNTDTLISYVTVLLGVLFKVCSIDEQG